MLNDQFGRPINYLRIAVTDHCNLRCTYCMPEKGLDWIKRKDLMTDWELLKICSIFTELGINKIRITGGEPFLRKDLMPLLENISKLENLSELTITTNGLLTQPHISELKNIGVRSVNISLDTLDKNRFFQITRRNGLEKVIDTIYSLLEYGIKAKINCVVMDGKNIEDLLPLAYLSEKLPIDVRFIEEMPFNGTQKAVSLKWDFIQILNHIKKEFPDIAKIQDSKYSTSYNYHIPGFTGNIGIVAAYTRSFCGTCNRLRITPDGTLRTCLYEATGINLKDTLRARKSDEELKGIILNAVQKRPKDGWEAEKSNHNTNFIHESMATIGG